MTWIDPAARLTSFSLSKIAKSIPSNQLFSEFVRVRKNTLTTKSSLRSLRMAQRKQLQHCQVTELSQKIRAGLLRFLDQNPDWSTLFGFAAFRNEPDILSQSNWQGLALPRILSKSKMEFYRVDDLQNLAPGSFGILEPAPEPDQKKVPDSRTCILVPALGLNSRNHRLGYGGGFYDRYLKENPAGLRLAVCYENEKRADFPSDSWDIPCHGILTEAGVQLTGPTQSTY